MTNLTARRLAVRVALLTGFAQAAPAAETPIVNGKIPTASGIASLSSQNHKTF
jgi:hypothetical protein